MGNALVRHDEIGYQLDYLRDIAVSLDEAMPTSRQLFLAALKTGLDQSDESTCEDVSPLDSLVRLHKVATVALVLSA